MSECKFYYEKWFYIPSGNTISNDDIDYVSEQIIKLKKKINVKFQCSRSRSFGVKRAKAIQECKNAKLDSVCDKSPKMLISKKYFKRRYKKF